MSEPTIFEQIAACSHQAWLDGAKSATVLLTHDDELRMLAHPDILKGRVTFDRDMRPTLVMGLPWSRTETGPSCVEGQCEGQVRSYDLTPSPPDPL